MLYNSSMEKNSRGTAKWTILKPVYSWSYDTTASTYTRLLLVSGYFRSDMEDVTEVINRFWRLYSSGYVTKIAGMAVHAETFNQDKIRL